jgi:ParB family transcriptional regulator, chromosome partitioning protein
MAWARELERIESVKAKKRQGLRTDANCNIRPNSDKSLPTDDVVAKEVGIGSRDTYRKAKVIEAHADQQIIDQLNEEKISIHKAYMETHVVLIFQQSIEIR